MSSQRATVRGYIAALTGIVLGSTVIAIAALPGLHPGAMLANHWASKLSEMPNEQVEAQMSRIAGLGDSAIPVLAKALASQQDAVAMAARKTINEQLGQWQSLSRRRSSLKVALLAKHVARNVESLNPVNQVAAADMAMEILLWPVDGGAIDNGQLIADCETVLRAYSSSESSSSDSFAVARQPRSKTIAAEDQIATVGSRSHKSDNEMDTSFDSHTAGLPAEIVAIPTLPVSSGKKSPDATGDETRPNYIDAPRRILEPRPLSPDYSNQLSDMPPPRDELPAIPPIGELERASAPNALREMKRR